MTTGPSTSDSPPTAPRFCFTPWKLSIALVSFGLLLATFTLLDWLIPGDTQNATTRVVAGAQVFEVTSRKDEWMVPVFFASFVGYPSLLYYLLWKPYSRSREYRFSLEQGEASKVKSPVLRVIAYVIYVVVLGLVACLLVWVIVVRPIVVIHRITPGPQEVEFRSLFWSWQAPRAEIDHVEVRREQRRRRRPDYAALIVLKDGTTFRTSEVTALDFGGRDDLRVQRFFDELKEALE